ncbi:hypothetical protein BBJ28_00001896 [Nothophytophthora sp. Chile5]|nr:hypothetical protein BBJ28_00001896 [Nothophytophthora sp. Chile5]
MKLFLPAFVASALLLLSGDADALNVRLSGVNYNSRKGPDWASDSDRCKTQDEVQRDMNSIKTFADRVRIYSLVDCNQGEMVLPAAKAAGLKVHLGIWTTNDHNYLIQEKNKLAALVDAGLVDDNVIGLHVGSETVYRKEITADTAISYMNEIRSYLRDRNVNTPVTIADVIDVYYANQQLIDAVDYVSVNQFSFWERADVNEGMAVTLDRLKNLRVTAAQKNKRVVISEIGWSSSGEDPAASVASPANQAKFFSDFFQSARAHDFEYYWYMAFDSQWRVANGGKVVEANFGIFKEDESMKSNFQQLTIGWMDPSALRNAGTKLLLSENNGGVYMSAKSSDWLVQEQQTWFFNSTTSQVRSKSSDRCLDAYQSWDGGIVHVYRCMDSEGNQKWSYNSTTGQLKHATHTGFCLDQDPAQGNKLQLWGCSDNNANQQWGVMAPADISDSWSFSDGSVRFYTMESAKPFAQLVRNGDEVAVGYGGSNVAGSEWFFDTNTHLIKAKGSDKCLDAYQAWDGGIVHVFTCNTQEPNQLWSLDASTNQLRHMSHTDFCLDADLSANGGAGKLQLWGCHLNNNNQVWRRISASATAVTAHSSSASDAFLQPTTQDTVMGAASTGSSLQHWFWDASAKHLVSKINAQCLDAYEGWQGGRVHTYTCIAAEANQGWSYDATNQMLKHVKHAGFCLAFDSLSSKLLQLKTCDVGDNTQRIRLENA